MIEWVNGMDSFVYNLILKDYVEKFGGKRSAFTKGIRGKVEKGSYSIKNR